MGKRGENNLQGGETELCVRLHQETGERVIYNPDAVASHRIYDYRTDRTWLLERSFWQGYSKQYMEQLAEGSTDTEYEFVADIVTKFIPERVRSLITRPSVDRLDEFAMLLLLTGAAGGGYGYALIKDTLE
jgi:hypothetical protein